MRMLIGYEGEIMQANVITTQEEVDYQFWYGGRNKVIEEYSYIKADSNPVFCSNSVLVFKLSISVQKLKKKSFN